MLKINGNGLETDWKRTGNGLEFKRDFISQATRVPPRSIIHETDKTTRGILPQNTHLNIVIIENTIRRFVAQTENAQQTITILMAESGEFKNHNEKEQNNQKENFIHENNQNQNSSTVTNRATGKQDKQTSIQRRL
jgi:hypothetical protein